MTWKFIHSESFSQEISQRVSSILTKKMGAELKFVKVEFGLFPPSTRFKQVNLIKKNQQNIGATIFLDELGVYFTFGSLFSSNLEIDELELKNGKVKLEIDEDPTRPDINWRAIELQDLYEKYSVIYSKLPVHLNILRLTNIETQINNVKFVANSVSILPHKKQIRIKAKINELQIEHQKIQIESISGLITLEKDVVDVKEFSVLDRENAISLAAIITSPNKHLEAKINGKYNILYESLSIYLNDLPKELRDIHGKFSGELKSSGNLFDPNIDLNVEAKFIKSNWINLEYAKIKIHKKKNVISIGGFEATNKQEIYKSKGIQPVYDLHRKMFISNKTTVELTNAQTNTFLFTIRDSLEVFKGKITGKVTVSWDGKGTKFEINDKVYLKNFELKTTDLNKNILSNNGFTIEKGVIILENDMSVALDLNLTMPNSRLHAVGKIMKNQINIDLQNSTLDLKIFGPIAGVQLEGAGPVAMKLHGPMNDVRFDFDVQWKNFSVIDLHLGEVRTHFEFSLKDLTLTIPSLVGKYNLSSYIANGKFSFGNHSQMDIDFNFKETSFKDAREMYGLVFRNMKGIPEMDLKFETNYRVTGGFDLAEIVINGKIKGHDLKIFNEDAEFLSMDFSLNKEKLKFEKIKIQKSRGEVSGSLSIDLGNNQMELLGDSKGLKLSDFNNYRSTALDYDADLILEFHGNGTAAKFPTILKIKTTDAFIDNIVASPSEAIVTFANDEISSKLDILAGKIKAEIVVGLVSRQVSIKSNIDTQDLKELLGVLSSHNAIDKTITGKIKAKFQTVFSLASNKMQKLFIEIGSFNLRKGDVDIRNVVGRNVVSVDNGIVKKWDLGFVDGDDFFTSIGENINSGMVLISQSFSIKASIFQLISRYVDKANGKIKGSYQIEMGQNIRMSELSLYARNNSLKLKKMPGLITELAFDIYKENGSFLIKNVAGKYGEGDFKVTGNVLFENLYPKVSLEYKVERSTIPLFKRSSLLVSGSGSLQGSKPPYRLNGRFQLLHGEFLDDPSEYSGDKKISLEEFKKYLPEKNKDGARSFIDYNLNVETATSPLLVKNNMAEIYLKGAGQITGNPLDPELNGRIDALPGVSKFKFKGHDFIIGQGFVELKERGKVRNSDLKFVGVSKISDYEMKIDLSGKIDKLNINLSSEPALTQEDLLSLLTLGVTSDMSKNLEATERKFVTTVGIGTLLVDQLKINEDLNSSLGLKLSVMPEFKEDVTSLVQGKSAVTDSASSRLKSSTKIKVNKQLSKQVDVSLSSTVGGSLEQKQEVNVNYNFNKNLSLEGVYEVKPSEDTSTSTSTPNSIGADIKYRWSF